VRIECPHPRSTLFEQFLSHHVACRARSSTKRSKVNHKRVVSVVSRRKAGDATKNKENGCGVRPADHWSHRNEPTKCGRMDFAHAGMVNGRRSRTLNLTVGYTREALAIEVDTSLPRTPLTKLNQNNSEPVGLVFFCASASSWPLSTCPEGVSKSQLPLKRLRRTEGASRLATCGFLVNLVRLSTTVGSPVRRDGWSAWR
jgi:hypothetical protein